MSRQALPFMPLFVGDFLSKTVEFSGPQRALYMLLLAHQWSLGDLPTDLESLAHVAGYELKEFKRLWPKVSRKFVERDGRLINERLEEHRSHAIDVANKRAKAGAKGAAVRWPGDGKRDGNSDGKRIANGIAPPCHPIQSNPDLENSSSSEGESATSDLESDGLKTRGKSRIPELRALVGGAVKEVPRA